MELPYGFNDGSWKGNSTINLPFIWHQASKDNEELNINTQVINTDGEWKAEPSTELFTETIKLYDKFHEYHENRLYAPSEELEDLGWLSFRNENDEEDELYGSESVSLFELLSTDSVYHPQKIRLLYETGKAINNLGDYNLDYYYKTYKSVMRSYIQIYDCMMQEFGRENLLLEFNKATQKTDKDYARRFYIEFMIENNIDLKANVLHRKYNSTPVGFWFRRINDGTASTCYKIAVDIVKQFDPEFYKSYIKNKNQLINFTETFPSAKYKESYSTDYSAVTIINRRVQEDWIEYKIEVNGKTEWVHEGYITFKKEK